MVKPDIELDSPSVWDAYGTQDISGYDPVIMYTIKVYTEWAYMIFSDWPQIRWRYQTHLSPHCDWSVGNTVGIMYTTQSTAIIMVKGLIYFTGSRERGISSTPIETTLSSRLCFVFRVTHYVLLYSYSTCVL